MNECMIHQQKYDPATGWCIYCGRPSPDAGVVVAPMPWQPTPGTTGTPYWSIQCPNCGGIIGVGHVCTGTPVPLRYTITTSGSWTTPKDAA